MPISSPTSGAVGCGYDGSPAAREALNWAAEFARRGRRPLRVLAVQRQLAFGHVGVTGTFGAKSANDELRAGLAANLAQAVAALPNESVESEILEGDPAQRLAESSADLALLVLGLTRLRSGAERPPGQCVGRCRADGCLSGARRAQRRRAGHAIEGPAACDGPSGRPKGRGTTEPDVGVTDGVPGHADAVTPSAVPAVRVEARP